MITKNIFHTNRKCVYVHVWRLLPDIKIRIVKWRKNEVMRKKEREILFHFFFSLSLFVSTSQSTLQLLISTGLLLKSFASSFLFHFLLYFFLTHLQRQWFQTVLIIRSLIFYTHYTTGMLVKRVQEKTDTYWRETERERKKEK